MKIKSKSHFWKMIIILIAVAFVFSGGQAKNGFFELDLNSLGNGLKDIISAIK